MLEIAIIILFLIALYVAVDRRFLILATLFALIFENLNVILFAQSEGGYTYHGFDIYIFHVPLLVILSWGIILLSSYTLARKLSTRRWDRVFIATFLTVIIDIAIEFVSVKQGFWVWHSFQGEYLASVSPSNFIGWFLVSFAFLSIYQYRPRLSFLLGYPLFILLSIPLVTIHWLLGIEGMAGYYTVIFLMGFSGLITLRNMKQFSIGKEFSTIALRYPFYIFSLMFIGTIDDPACLLLISSAYLVELILLSCMKWDRLQIWQPK
ncbi:MAG: carotenoid biosynthesis protein [Nanobdellota archaeon]